MQFSVIVVAAGKSRRMGFDKLMHPLGESFTLQHSVSTFCSMKEVQNVLVVCPAERFQSLQPHPKLRTVSGGAERWESVKAGLDALPKTDFIAVHDGARPLIQETDILAVFEAAQAHDAATAARPITDTLKRSDTKNFTMEHVSRENLWAMETPQIFSSSTIQAAYQKVMADKLPITDEVSAVESLGIQSKLVKLSAPNLKVTYPEDIQMAERLLKHTTQS